MSSALGWTPHQPENADHPVDRRPSRYGQTMLQSELAEEMNSTPSVVRKWLTIYSQLTERPVGRRLDAQTISDMLRARALTQERPSMAFREALERTLGQYTEAIPPASVTQLMGQLDRLEAHQRELQTNQEAMASKLEAIADYLRKMLSRRSGTGDPNALTSFTDENNSGR